MALQLDGKQKSHLRNVFQKDGLQACLTEAKNNLEGIMLCKNEVERDRIHRIAHRFKINVKGWTLDGACGPYWGMMSNPKINKILFCSPWMKGEKDETVAFFLAHEVSHKKTRDEALATLHAIEILKDKMPDEKLKSLVGLWYEDYMNRSPVEKAAYHAQYEHLERIRRYITSTAGGF